MAVYTDVASLRLQKPENKNYSLHRCSQSPTPETGEEKNDSLQKQVSVSRNLNRKMAVYTDTASLRFLVQY